VQDLHEINARKVSLTNSINSIKKQLSPLEEELEELKKMETQIKKTSTKKQNEKEGA
jgi:prefoldin subunit 5